MRSELEREIYILFVCFERGMFRDIFYCVRDARREEYSSHNEAHGTGNLKTLIDIPYFEALVFLDELN